MDQGIDVSEEIEGINEYEMFHALNNTDDQGQMNDSDDNTLVNKTTTMAVTTSTTKNTNSEYVDNIASRYEKVDKYRDDADFFYNFLNVNHMAFKNHYLTSLVDLMMTLCGSTPTSVGLSKDDHKTLKRIIAENDDVPKDALWFAGISTIPQFSSWFFKGDPNSTTPEGRAPPLMASKPHFEYYIRTIVQPLFFNLLDGVVDLRIYVRTLRSEYFITSGPPMPPGLAQHYGYSAQQSVNYYQSLDQ